MAPPLITSLLCSVFLLTTQYSSLVVVSLPIASPNTAAHLPSEHRQLSVQQQQQQEMPSSLQVEPIKRSSYEMGSEPGETEPPKPNVFFSEPLPKAANDASTPNSKYVAPNYFATSDTMAHPNLSEDLLLPDGLSFAGKHANLPSGALSYYPGLLNQMSGQTEQQQQQQPKPPSEDTINDMFQNTFKKYNVKQYLLRKIFGNQHEIDEDDGGFFSNKHLKRHGTAGVAAKVIGELIGIKIRESIEGLGKSFSEYAKDFTARNFVSLGQVFTRMFKA